MQVYSESAQINDTGEVLAPENPREARAFLCGTKARPLSGRVPPGADLLFRNAQQDVALAAAGAMPLRDEMKKTMGACNAAAPADPEFYLRLLDYLLTPLWEKVR